MHPKVTLLQYVDDLLLAADTKENCESGTQALLSELAQLGYKASAKKAQICQQEVIFLGYSLRGGKRWLTEPRKQTIVQIPPPSNRRVDEEAKLAALNRATMLTLSTPGEHKSGDLTTSEHPNNLTSKDTDTELLDFTDPSLQFQKALHYVKNVYQLTHFGSKKLQAFQKDQEQSFPLTDSQRKEIAERVTKAYRVCQLVNAYPSKLPAGKRIRGTRPGQFWEMDFTEIKPARLKALERTQRYL
ncbi:uncharacterized protein LOC107150191 isoform X2 [Marmota marmota marmota]|uniref:uncharacterized protein LOC107150191 isoform X2 n=1 Tax=Marmota marmota marmota TaxID=9994 RepID=UPI002093854A|nr:uncharacterized protein LOC107150191 isoform X2 [Marmota marmota marmota]